MNAPTKIKPPTVIKSEEEWRGATHARAVSTSRASTAPSRPSAARTGTRRLPALYACVCCGEPLFSSETKFNSGTGWPSYYAPVAGEAISEYTDRVVLHAPHRGALRQMRRPSRPRVSPTARKPTGLRYCINGHALKFAPKAGT